MGGDEGMIPVNLCYAIYDNKIYLESPCEKSRRFRCVQSIAGARGPRCHNERVQSPCEPLDRVSKTCSISILSYNWRKTN